MRKIQSIIISMSFMTAMTLVVHAGDSKDMKDFRMTANLQEPDAGPYVAAYGGADFTNINDGSKYEIGDVGPTHFSGGGIKSGGGSTTNTVGGVGGVKIGYNFESYDIDEGFRLQPAVEVEALYIGGTGTNNFSYSSPEVISVKSSYENAAAMVNGLVRFKIDSPVTPYIGFGVGAEYFNATDVSLVDNFSGHYAHYDNGEFVFAGQGLVGLDIELAKHWSLFTEFKFIIMDNPRTIINGFNTDQGSSAHYTYRPDYIGQNIGVAGIKYSF